MNESQDSRRQVTAGAIFFTIFFLVFLVVVTVATLVTFILPESYASTARVKVERKFSLLDSMQTNLPAYDPTFIPTQVQVIQSESILRTVVEVMDLNAEWGKRYGGGDKFMTTTSLQMLKARMDVRPILNTSIIQIRVFSDDRVEAAKLANTIAEVYRSKKSLTDADALRIEMIDTAYPGSRPIRPNKPLNITLGVIMGVVLGTFIGGIVTWLSSRNPKKTRNETSPPPLVTSKY
jgi:uncharacterized protein involved in exopolysaccharide biosynthesis